MNSSELSLVLLATLPRYNGNILNHHLFLELELVFGTDFGLWNESFERFGKFQNFPLRNKPNILVYVHL